MVKRKEPAPDDVAARLSELLGANARSLLGLALSAETELSLWLASRGRAIDAELRPEDLAPIVRETSLGTCSLRFASLFHRLRRIVTMGVGIEPDGTVTVPAGVKAERVPAPLRTVEVPDPVADFRAAFTATLEALADVKAEVRPELILRAVARLEEPSPDAQGVDSRARVISRARAEAWGRLGPGPDLLISGVPPRRKPGRPKKLTPKSPG